MSRSPTFPPALDPTAAASLEARGFAVIPGPYAADRLNAVVEAYDSCLEAATGSEIRVGTTTTRVNDLLGRHSAFDEIITYPPILQAAAQVIGGPLKLSSLLARSLRPDTPGQGLHVDVPRHAPEWPLLGFILMIDAFTAQNGATCFVPGTHRHPDPPPGTMPGPDALLGTGPAGAHIVFNGSTWHEHSANTTAHPRRSIQGAFIPRSGKAGTDWGARLSPAVIERLGSAAREVLAV